MNNKEIKDKFKEKLIGEVGVTLPALPKHKSMKISDDSILLEDFVSSNGARNIVTVNIDDLITTLGLDSKFLAKNDFTYQDLVDSDPLNDSGYQKYFDKWKTKGLIS